MRATLARAVMDAGIEVLAPALLQKLVAMPLPDGVLLNVNFPNCMPDDVKGIAVDISR